MKTGFFIEPTIISDVTTSMQIWREKVFGPVLCVKSFQTEEEAIEKVQNLGLSIVYEVEGIEWPEKTLLLLFHFGYYYNLMFSITVICFFRLYSAFIIF